MIKKLDGLTKALIFVAAFDTIFVITMIVLFCIYQSVPDILIESVFHATVGETSATAIIFVIKKIKEKKPFNMDELCNIESEDETEE